ncbi:MAG: hypothetical protein ACRC10_03700 [Thermoguttaceae bacterium]
MNNQPDEAGLTEQRGAKRKTNEPVSNTDDLETIFISLLRSELGGSVESG